MGAAAQIAAQRQTDASASNRIAELRNRLERGILQNIDDTHIIGNPAHRLPNTTHIGFAGLEAEAILLLLSEQDICASAGAACSSGSLEPSPVLRAMGIHDTIGHGAVRFSLSKFTTEAEIDQTIAVFRLSSRDFAKHCRCNERRAGLIKGFFSMQLEAAARIAQELMADFGLIGTGLFRWASGPKWEFGWNRRKRSLGLCRYRDKKIELSVYFVAANGEVEIRDTVLHEIAHALAGQRAGHGPKWKSMCLRLGCKPERCDKGEAIMPRGRWEARCPTCGKEYWRHKRPQRGARYWCRGCGPEHAHRLFSANQPTPAIP